MLHQNINSCPSNPPGSSVRMRQSTPSEWQSKHIPARVFFLQRCFRIIMNNAMYRKMCEIIKIPLHNTWTSQESHCHLLCGSCRDCPICAGRGKLSLLLPSKSSLILGFFFLFFYKRAWIHISQQIPAAKLQFMIWSKRNFHINQRLNWKG